MRNYKFGSAKSKQRSASKFSFDKYDTHIYQKGTPVEGGGQTTWGIQHKKSDVKGTVGQTMSYTNLRLQLELR